MGVGVDIVEQINDNSAASIGFDRLIGVDKESALQARINEGSVFRKSKAALSNPFRLAGQINRTFFHSGFFTPIDAVYEYGRDNQPNDISGNATRTRTGGNRGLMIDRVREHFSLLSQAFNPEIEECVSLSLPLAKDGSVRNVAERLSEPVMNSLG